MKKITTTLGSSHNEFEHQLKDVINYMSDIVSNISKEQQLIVEHQNKLFLKQHIDATQSPICDICHSKAVIMTINIPEGTYKSFCNKCLAK